MHPFYPVRLRARLPVSINKHLPSQALWAFTLAFAVASPGFLLRASAQGSRTKITAASKAPPPSKAAVATPTSGSKTNFTLTVDQNYCDVSLPYSYSSTSSTLKLRVGNRKSSQWNSVFTQKWPLQDNAVTFEDTDQYASGDRDSPPILDGKTVELNDNGGALLSDPAHELSTDTFDAQRLLVRTIFSPNPFQVACSYPYIKYQSQVTVANAQNGADGKPIDLIAKGVVNEFSLNNPKTAPQYYLIDIVRWKDATAPTGAPATVPFFQPVSDDWYLLNYSDAKARPQDISTLFQRITPSLASDTLRILGSSKVMFLAIHLAPVATDSSGKAMYVPVSKGADGKTVNADGSPVMIPGAPAMTATQQAWFDDVTIKYSIQATAYEPTQMQDFSSLIDILKTFVPGGPPAGGLAGGPTVNDLIDAFLRGEDPNNAVNMAKPIIYSTYQGRYAAGLLTNLTALPVNLTNTWTASFSSKTSSLGKSIFYGAAAPTTTTPLTPACAVSLDTTDKTKQADCVVTGAKVQNEGLSFWDVSVVVPASSYSDVTFQASATTGGSNSITTSKTVSRTNAYAVFDLFLYPEDLVRPPNLGIPHIVVGLPFAGKTLDKPYFAVGETINLPNTLGKLKIFNWIPGVSTLVSQDLPLSLRPTFGWVYNKVFPTPGSNTSYRSLKPQFGVEISIKGLVKTLSKSSSTSTGTTQASKTSTGSTVPQTESN